MKLRDFLTYQPFLIPLDKMPDEKEKFEGEKWIDGPEWMDYVEMKWNRSIIHTMIHELTFIIEGNGEFLAAFHVDIQSDEELFILDSAMHFYYPNQSESTKCFFRVKIMKIHHCPNTPGASTFDQMGSLSHQIALLFDDEEGGKGNDDLIYMLNPNRIKFKLPLKRNQADQEEIPIGSLTLSRKETWPCLHLSYEPLSHKSFIAMRLYPLTDDRTLTSWNEGIKSLDLLRKEISAWLSSLTDPTLSYNSRLQFNSIVSPSRLNHLENPVWIIEKMHQDLLSCLSLDFPPDMLSSLTNNFRDLSWGVSELERLGELNRLRNEGDSLSISDEAFIQNCIASRSRDEWETVVQDQVEKILAKCI